MRSFLFRAIWLSSVVTAELVTITEWATCPTYAAFTAPSYNSTASAAPAYNSTPAAVPSSSSSSVTSASARPTGAILGSLGPGAAASSVQSNKVDFLFWLEFANAVITAAGIQPSANDPVFVGREAQTGPLAGDNIADGYTNQGIYQLANNLLNDSSIWYAPSDSYGYVDALSNYLDYVDLEVKPTAKQENDLLNWEKDLKAAHSNTVAQKKAAQVDFADDVDLGEYQAGDWLKWLANGNGQLYKTALDRENGIQAKVSQLQVQINGAKGGALRTSRLGIEKARSDSPYPGYNMLATSGASQSLSLLTRCEDMTPEESATTCPPPTTFNVPLYDAQGYKEFVQEAQRATADDYVPKGATTITVDSKKTTSQYNFGQTSVGADVSGGWFSPWSASGKHTTTSETFSTTAAASSVSIKMTWDAIQTITITAGKWNFDPGQFKLRSDAPSFLKQLIRPTQLIVATRVGYQISVSDSLATAIDTHFKETTAAGGGFRIFGITVGASASHTTETETHEATFDSASKTLTVVPRDVYGAATLLGIVGERIQI